MWKLNAEPRGQKSERSLIAAHVPDRRQVSTADLPRGKTPTVRFTSVRETSKVIDNVTSTVLGGKVRTHRIWFLTVPLAALLLALLMAVFGKGSHASTRSAAGHDAVRHWEVSTADELLRAIEQLAPTGGTICLQSGDYVMDGTIEVRAKNCINLVGTGWDTKIVRQGDGDLLRFTDVGFCTVRNLLLLGTDSATSGSAIVYRGNSSSCTIDFCRIVNFPESGVRYEGNPQHPMSSNTVRNCHFIGNLGDQLWSSHNNDFYIIGNQFGTHRGFPHSGCVLDHSSAGSYCLNYHWGNHVALRIGPGANFNRVENNRFEESRESGLMIGSPEGGDANMFNIITGNTFHTNSQAKSGEYPAVVSCDAHETTFCGNQIFSWNSDQFRHRHSLVIGKNCDRWIVKDNIFRHNTHEPLVYDETRQMIVRDNLAD